MNLSFKRSLQVCAAIAALSTTACVIDPYYSGVDYDYTGTTVHPINTVSTQTVYTNSAASFTSGFLIGNAYYWNDRYYPVNYYTNNNRRYYRPDFNRPAMYHPNARYRNLNASQMNHWKRNQASSFDPRYRPNLNHSARPNQDRPNVRPDNNRPNVQQHTRPNRPAIDQQRPQVNQNRPQIQPPHSPQRPNVRPQNNRPNVQPPMQPNRPQVNQQRPQTNQHTRPAPQKFGPNLNAAQRQEIMRQMQQNRQSQYQQNRQAREFQNRRMNER